jgi:hypothetical protein
MSGVSNPLLAFYDIPGRKGRYYSFLLPRTSHETRKNIISLYLNVSTTGAQGFLMDPN